MTAQAITAPIASPPSFRPWGGGCRARPLGVAGTHGGGRRARWPLPRMWGYFSIPEFEALNHAKGFSVIERDEHFEPAPVREVRR